MTGRLSGLSFTKVLGSALAMGLILALAGCAGDDGPELPKLGDLNPFKEKVTPLPGRRVALISDTPSAISELGASTIPVTIPAVRSNDAWTQPGGEPTNAPGNLAIGSELKKTWTGEAGSSSFKLWPMDSTSNSKKGHIISSPVVADGRVFTLDADGLVSAFSINGGSALWKTALTGEGGQKGTGFGGGLALDGGRLYGASGYGIVAALDPATGAKVWEKNIGSPIRTSPTAAGGRVYVVSSVGRFHCLNGADGNEMWAVRGLQQTAGLMNNASPAVDGDIVVAPYTSGDVVALSVADGKALWTESLTRTKLNAQLSSLTDAARPAISDGIVYAVGHAGKMVATRIRTGERLWSANIAGTQTPWVAGDSVFVVDTGGQLSALSRVDGKAQWVSQLPIEKAKLWSGPTLAGGYLWLVSNKGKLIAVDATTGKIVSELSLGEEVFVAPVVAAGKMFVLTDSAKLIALN